MPSAELSDEQNVDEGKGDPIFYPYHDKLLQSWSDWRSDPEIVLACALKGTLEKDIECELGTIKKYFPTRKAFVDNLEWAWARFNVEFKRAQTPPIFIWSRHAFGSDRRDTIASEYFTEEYHRLKVEYLKETKI